MNVLFGVALELLGVFLGLAPQTRRVILGPPHQLGGGFVRRAQDAGGLEPERSGERRLVEHRIGRPVLGFGERPAKLLLPVARRHQLTCHMLEERPDLGRVEAAPLGAEGMACDLVGMDTGGRRDREPLVWHGREPTTRWSGG